MILSFLLCQSIYLLRPTRQRTSVYNGQDGRNLSFPQTQTAQIQRKNIYFSLEPCGLRFCSFLPTLKRPTTVSVLWRQRMNNNESNDSRNNRKCSVRSLCYHCHFGGTIFGFVVLLCGASLCLWLSVCVCLVACVLWHHIMLRTQCTTHYRTPNMFAKVCSYRWRRDIMSSPYIFPPHPLCVPCTVRLPLLSVCTFLHRRRRHQCIIWCFFLLGRNVTCQIIGVWRRRSISYERTSTRGQPCRYM